MSHKILVAPIRHIDTDIVSQAFRALTSTFPNFKIIVAEEVYIPDTDTYDEIRNQWRADAVAYGLAIWARRTHGCGRGCMVLGVSLDDGYAPDPTSSLASPSPSLVPLQSLPTG